MYFQLLRDNLLTIEYNHDTEIQQLVHYCRPIYVKNKNKVTNIDKFEREYDQKMPVYWYTLETFMYLMLNHVLRTTNTEILIKMRFSIRDLHEQTKERHLELDVAQIPVTVSRDPGTFNNEFEELKLGNGNGWRRLDQFDKTREIIVDLDDKAEHAFLHNQLGYVWKQKDNLKEASSHYKKSLDISLSYMSDTDPRLSSTYSNVGGILKKLGNPDEALKWYELVLKIDLAAPEPNQLEIAIDHNNIGSVLDDLGKYSEALKSYDQALDIKLAYLPPHHSSLASTYSNIGLIHRKMGDSSTALSLYKKALEIQEKSLAQNDPSFRITYGKLAIVLEDLHRYKEAIEYAEQAVNIARNAFGPSHQEVENRQQYLEKLQQKIWFSLTDISHYF
jgi:tetratricopeptide (TPR) repeat protein